MCTSIIGNILVDEFQDQNIEGKSMARNPVVVIAVIILALIILYALYILFSGPSVMPTGETQSSRLSEEEKIAILNSLNKSASAESLTDSEKTAILDSLQDNSANHLTDEEKKAILDSLQ